MRVNKDQDDWDDQLPSVLLSYRISKQESTGVSPFELMYGRSARLPFDVDREGEVERKPIGGSAQYVEELKHRHELLKSFVADRINDAQQKQKKNYDKAHRTEKSYNFVVGELVLLKDHRARGLAAKYLGPYRVIRVLNEDCEIESLDNGKRKIVHSNSLREFTFENMPINKEEQNLLSESDDSDADEIVYCANRPLVENENINKEAVRYNLRRNRRRPERYGAPVYDY